MIYMTEHLQQTQHPYPIPLPTNNNNYPQLPVSNGLSMFFEILP